MRPRDPVAWLLLGVVGAAVLVVGTVAVLLGGTARPAPAPVSNPGAGVDAPALTPRPRFDWTDQ
jgi:hypothetical protein